MVSPLSFLFFIGIVAAETDHGTRLKQEGPKNDCKSVRAVSLGIHGFYDESFITNRRNIKANESIDEYLSLLVKSAGHQHFTKIRCTNISLVLTGASALNQSDVVQRTSSESLEVDPTLSRFQNYWMQHRPQLGYPDVGILFTALHPMNTSEGCRKIREEVRESLWTGKSGPPEYRAYCDFLEGAAFYKGICGNNSVALVRDTGGVFHGTTMLAKAILYLFGVKFDILRKEEKCRQSARSFLTSDASPLSPIPDLSPCAEEELTDFIDCASNLSFACWNDTPCAAVINTHRTPYEFLQQNNYCGRISDRHFRCPADSNISEQEGCALRCCKFGYSDDQIEDYAVETPYGKSCGRQGTCFLQFCFEEDGNITYYNRMKSRYENVY